MASRMALATLASGTLPPLAWFVWETTRIELAYVLFMAVNLVCTVLANIVLAGTSERVGWDVYFWVGCVLLVTCLALAAIGDTAGFLPGNLVGLFVGLLCLWGGLGGAGIGLVSAVATRPVEDRSWD